MMRPRRTTQRYDLFGELDHRQFEDLVRQLAPRARSFRVPLDPVGRVGSDEGRDAEGVEIVRQGRRLVERPWRLQMKRYEKITPKQLEKIVEDAVPDPAFPPYGLLVATSADVSTVAKRRYGAAANNRGVTEAVVWGRSSIVDLLQDPRNHDIKRLYVGEERAVDGTQLVPLALSNSPSLDLAVYGRDDEVAELRAQTGDVVLVGEPQSGKSRLALELSNARFAWIEASADDLADSIRRHQPAQIVVDDAGLLLRQRQIETLRELRRAGHDFQIIATTWPHHRETVEQLLPGVRTIELDRLERQPMDELLQALGIKNIYFRHAILAQADGRPGWAITLAELAKSDRAVDVFTGRGMVEKVAWYLDRVGAQSMTAKAFVSYLAALGEVRFEEADAFDQFIGLGRSQREEMLALAAAAGLLEQTQTGRRVAPEILRFALVEHWFFDRTTADPIDATIKAWPGHRRDILTGVIRAAHAGSAKARTQLDRLLDSVLELTEEALDAYVRLDLRAARRALADTASLDRHEARRRLVIRVAAEHHRLPEAIRELLDAAVGDRRALHSHPDHPARLLGEVGSDFDPYRGSTFDQRIEVLGAANSWLGDQADDERALVWAVVVGQLLKPTASGTYNDPGDPRKFTITDAIESAQHLAELADRHWPLVAPRLESLNSEALVPFIDLLDDWLRIWKGGLGIRGGRPNDRQRRVAGRLAKTILAALMGAATEKPGAQIRLRDVTSLLRVPVKQAIDPEFALLTLDTFRLHRDGRAGFLQRRIDRLGAQWADEEPVHVIDRVQRWSTEARLVGRSLDPAIGAAMRRLATHYDERLTELVERGLESGLTYELRELMAASIARSQSVPPWFPSALRTGARSSALGAALSQSEHEATARAALETLDERDVWMAEQIVIRDREPSWISLELLRHPNVQIRGSVSLYFSWGEGDHAPEVPADWRDDWSAAFEVAPLEGRQGHDSWRLGQHLQRLIDSNPELIERWLMRKLDAEPHGVLWRLPMRMGPVFERLPRDARTRLLKRYSNGWIGSQLLGHLVGGDVEWLGQMLDDGVVALETAMGSLHEIEGEEDEPQLTKILQLAPTLIRHGADPRNIAAAALPRTWWGEESEHFERTRRAFEAHASSTDPAVVAVVEAGIGMFAEARDRAHQVERRERIRGEL